MRLTILYLAIFLCTLSLMIWSCKKTEPNTDFVNLQIPAGWPAPQQNIFGNTRPSQKGFQLGRRLFYDGRLSADGNYPCASCHQRIAAFGTFDHDFSHGHNNSHTLRNAPPLFNLAWMREFDWDGQYKGISTRIKDHLSDFNEMGGDLPGIIRKLEQDSGYKRQFIEVFGVQIGQPAITIDRVAAALTQFVGLLVSSNTKYDRVKNGQATFTPFEAEGYEIFKARCASCHQEPLFTDHSYRNNGIGFVAGYGDIGRMFVTGNAADSQKFRVPTLRNNFLTYPYMHDGRITTLEGVIEHYSSGVRVTTTTDTAVRNKPQLSQAEKTRLLQFLRALNDSTFATNPIHAPN
jgi:cytochrome c peroxidase